MTSLKNAAGAVNVGPRVASAAAEVLQFALHGSHSRATVKTDAPLETIVGNTAAAGLSGTLAVDPLDPLGAVGSVHGPTRAVKTGTDKRDADTLDPRFLDVAASDANLFVGSEVKQKPIATSRRISPS